MANSVQIQKVNWWHEAVIDWQLEYPHLKLYDCARHFGVTQSWLSVVINSDVFKELWAIRRENHSSYISSSLIDKTQALAHLTVETITEKIEKEKDNLSLSALKDTADTVFRALGYSPRPAVLGSQTNIFVGNVDKETLAESRRLMDERQVIDVESTPVSLAPEDDEVTSAS